MAIEFNSLETDIEPLKEEKPDSLADTLSQYKDAKVETVSEPPSQNATEDVPDSNNWKGDPRFYQRGSKKGTLREKPYVKATYNHAASTSIPATMLINGALFLSVINFIIPLLICTVNNYMSPKEKVTVKDLQLSKEEKKEIDPLMDATLKQLNIQGNPLILLSITLVSAYAMKFVNFKLVSKSENEEEKDK